MRKIFKISCGLILSIAFLNACSLPGITNTESSSETDVTPSEHEHTYSSSWSKNTTYHWHAATCGHDVVKDKEVHSLGDWIAKIEPTESRPGVEHRLCEICGYEETRPLDPLPHTTHTPGSEVIENLVPATCTQPGSYDQVYYCTICGEEISRSHEIISAKGHDHFVFAEENIVPPTCTQPGSFDDVVYCGDCGEEILRNEAAIPASGHKDLHIQHENHVDPTCTEAGSFDEVTYCGVCGEEIERHSHPVPATGHEHTHHTQENLVNPTCTLPGSYDDVVYCDECSAEISREQILINATGHQHLDQRTDNIVEPTCTTPGSYDVVTYCLDCNEDVSGEHHEIEALGHDLTHHEGKEPTVYEDGWEEYDTCSRCDYSTYTLIPATGTLSKLAFTSIGGNSWAAMALSEDISGEVVIPSSYESKPVTKIAAYGFYNCKEITSVKVPNSVTTISNGAFKYSSISSIVFGTSEIAIENEVFQYCDSLESLVLPDNVTSIGSECFANCSNLTSLKIGSGVTKLANRCIRSCPSLNSIILSEGLQSIMSYAIEGAAISSINIPSTVQSIGKKPFYGELTEINVDPANEHFCSVDGVLYNKEMTTLISCPMGKSGVVEVLNGTTEITDEAFSGCKNLTEIALPDSVATLGASAFSGCTSLSSINIPDLVTLIPPGAFSGCAALTSLTLSNNVTDINNGAFSSSGITSFVVPDSVQNMGSGVFSNTRPTTLTLPFVGGSKTSNRFLAYLFGAPNSSVSNDYVPSSLKEVIVSDECTSLSSGAFRNCTYIEKVYLPCSSSIASASSIFEGCTSLTDIYFRVSDISTYVNMIKHYSINNTHLLNNDGEEMTDIVIPGSITSIGDSKFYRCTNIVSLVIEEGVTSIGENTFNGCSKLETVTLPNSMETVSVGAFRSCESLTSVVIGSGVTYLGTECFGYCTNLNSITFNGTSTQWQAISKDKYWNRNVPANCIHCTDGDLHF